VVGFPIEGGWNCPSSRAVTGDGIYAEFQSEQYILGETLSK